MGYVKIKIKSVASRDDLKLWEDRMLEKAKCWNKFCFGLCSDHELRAVHVLGRRCWLNSGSHDAAQNIAFMYSLYESCKMNDIDFGEYVEDILTRMMNGDDDYRSMIPCRSNFVRLQGKNYTPAKKQEKKIA